MRKMSIIQEKSYNNMRIKLFYDDKIAAKCEKNYNII